MAVFRTMSATDLPFAASCAADEGWSDETLEEFEGFHSHDPDGCFVLEEGGCRIGIGIATSYGEYGFIGEIIIRPDYRIYGLGRQLMDHAVSYLTKRGVRHICLDGVPKAAAFYEQAGFRRVCRSLRFIGSIQGRPNLQVRPMTAGDLESVFGLDLAAFGADRSFFLNRLFSLNPELSKVLEDNGKVHGYVFGRRSSGLVWAGPWYADDQVEQPEHLIESAAIDAAGLPIGLGVLEANNRAVSLVRSLGFSLRRNPSWRMVMGTSDRLGISGHLYAIGSAARG